MTASVLATPRRSCRSCFHPAHLGICTARSGGTAYACGCVAVTLADDPDHGKPAAAAEPPEPCLDCERSPCACADVGDLEDRFERALGGEP